MGSHKLAYIETDDLTVMGYSVAGEETVVAVPQLDVCFDIGKAPDQVISIDNLLLTHGHMDHAAGIAYYLSHRKFCGQKPGTVLTPKNTVKPISTIVKAWGKLDGNEIPVYLVGVEDGDECEIKPNIFARAFATKHSRGAVGYSVIERRKKLKEEYLGLSGPEIVDLKKQGVTIDYTVEIPLVSYLGDTEYMDFAQLEHVRKSKILIAECTFLLEEHRERAHAGRHMHIDQFADLVERMDNQTIIVTHLTQRMGIGEAKKILRKRMSAESYKKTRLLMDRKFMQS
ncbi:ribonuclease Z [Anaerohalosphaera lusitana]|uniref:Ribonuclease Z n=1 Tax=Anaerohalosphaera lusitana TaxID=1936003 RepID=A0A1U9NLC2_9BACT|nr:MBL fold metallo-hydrolase [Anaerohalosphaera lusitana]AQT68597.1 ribonuclease Z [Anaerohalosphaera lusitana]